MRRIGFITVVIGMLMAVYTMPVAGSQDPWEAAVTVGVCELVLHPSGRSAYYTTSLDPDTEYGPVHKPDEVTIDLPDGGWVDVRLIHRPGDDDGESVTKRFEVEGPCDTTTTTGVPSSTTLPETTTTVSSTTTSTVLDTTTSEPPDGSPTTTVTPSSSTTTSTSTTSTSVAVTTTLPETTTTVHIDTTVATTTTIDGCTDADVEAGLCLANTGIDSLAITVVGGLLMLLGGVTVWATRGES